MAMAIVAEAKKAPGSPEHRARRVCKLRTPIVLFRPFCAEDRGAMDTFRKNQSFLSAAILCHLADGIAVCCCCWRNFLQSVDPLVSLGLHTRPVWIGGVRRPAHACWADWRGARLLWDTGPSLSVLGEKDSKHSSNLDILLEPHWSLCDSQRVFVNLLCNKCGIGPPQSSTTLFTNPQHYLLLSE